jgi:hypothetical protein
MEIIYPSVVLYMWFSQLTQINDFLFIHNFKKPRNHSNL